MLYFITGKPGNGKTLYTIAQISKLQKESERSVYYDGVPLLPLGEEKLKWIKFNVEEPPAKLPDGRLRIWPAVPDGSIVIVDEVQRYWRQRTTGSKVPEIVQAIETHRHFGLDIYFCSQDPQLVDINIRKLASSHEHLKRRAMMEVATIYKWSQKVANPDSKTDQKDAIDSIWKYQKEFYGYYKSSELHTAKADIPWMKIMIVVALVLFLIGALYYVFFTGWGNTGDSALDDHSAVTGVSMVSSFSNGGQTINTNPWASDRWVARTLGRPNTAPVYDKLQQVRSQPSVKGCMQLAYDDGTVECTCTGGQGYKLDIPVPQCLKMMKRGWFDPTKPAEDYKAINIAALNARDRPSTGQQGKQGPSDSD